MREICVNPGHIPPFSTIHAGLIIPTSLSPMGDTLWYLSPAPRPIATMT